MKMNLTYGSSFELIITTIYGEDFTYEMKSCTLQDAIDYAEMIFGDETLLRSYAVSKVMICDAYTGEICAECEPDHVEDVGFENPNYPLNW